MNKFKKFAVIGTLTVAMIGTSAATTLAQQPMPPFRDTPRGDVIQCLRIDNRNAIAAEVLGISEEDLQARLAEGQTLREIAEELGIDLSTADIAAIRETMQDERRQKLADALGMTVEDLEAAWLEGQSIREIIDAQGLTVLEVVEAFDGECLENFSVDPMMDRLQATAEALGMTVEELGEALANGQTILEIAEAQGVDLREQMRLQAMEPLAEALNMTVEELQAALDGGQTIREIAEAQGVDLSTLRNMPGLRDRMEQFRGNRGPRDGRGGPHNFPFGGGVNPMPPESSGNNG